MVYIINTVCTGNICRSAMAKIVLKKAFANIKEVQINSSAISGEEEGNRMDSRAAEILENSGFVDQKVDIDNHIAHKVTSEELKKTDLFLAFTHKHANYLIRAGANPQKVYMYRQFETIWNPNSYVDRQGSVEDIIDPWYGDMDDFAIALEQIMDCTRNIVKFVSNNLKLENNIELEKN
ncbi:MAG: low molecular weight phosphotyrosine protein phosphatase [Bifidobacteriaceae bacterium]|jgi:protein-tyrosine phosphatase|nr:low molecular weight phosphotyrosine protein phosphatase [Bifidobacteriaceae bacterium]